MEFFHVRLRVHVVVVNICERPLGQ